MNNFFNNIENSLKVIQEQADMMTKQHEDYLHSASKQIDELTSEADKVKWRDMLSKVNKMKDEGDIKGLQSMMTELKSVLDAN